MSDEDLPQENLTDVTSFNSVLIVYSNPDNKDLKCQKVLDITYNSFKAMKIKVEVINIDEVQFLVKNENTNNVNNSHNSNFSNPLINLTSSSAINIKENDKNLYTTKINSSDLIVFIFPLVWGSCPSRLKLWMEICYNDGLNLTSDSLNIYSNGKMKGKLAVGICTTDSDKNDFGYKGKFILPLEEILEHFTHGMLALYGYSVFPLFVFYNQITNQSQMRDYEELESFIRDLSNKDLIYNNPKIIS